MRTRRMPLFLSLIMLAVISASFAVGQSYSYTVNDRSDHVVRFSITGGMNVHQVIVSVNVNNKIGTPSFTLSLTGSGTDDFSAYGLTLNANAFDSGTKWISFYSGIGDNTVTDTKYVLDIAKRPITGAIRGKVDTNETWVLNITGLSSPNVVTVTIGERTWNAGSWGTVDAEPRAGAIYPNATSALTNTGAALDAPPVSSIATVPLVPTVNAGSTVAFTAGQSDDPLIPPYTYTWTFAGGTGIAVSYPTTPDKPSVTYNCSTGGYSATVKVTDTNGQYGTATVTVQVNAPKIAVAPLTLGSYTYASTVQGGSLPIDFTVTNTGEGQLQFTGATPVSFVGAHPSFSIVAQPDHATVDAPPVLASSKFTIAFAPVAPATGTQSATVQIASNDPAHGAYTFTITGTVSTDTTVPKAPRGLRLK